MRLIKKIIRYSILMPIWMVLTVAMIPSLIGIVLFDSILTNDWNWWRIIKTTQKITRQPYRSFNPLHRARLRDECDREFVLRVAAYFRTKRNKNKVNWNRDGF